jgi:hypothetical protein
LKRGTGANRLDHPFGSRVHRKKRASQKETSGKWGGRYSCWKKIARCWRRTRLFHSHRTAATPFFRTIGAILTFIAIEIWSNPVVAEGVMLTRSYDMKPIRQL